MESPSKPILFLAFANDRQDDARYLRNLPQELASIRERLEKAEAAGLCELIVRTNTTVSELIDVFQAHRGCINVFHFGGHAGGFELLMESAEGHPELAHAEGLAEFLGHQQGLQLAFLNGCSTQPQVEGLLAAGIPAVVATAQAIDDAIATELSLRFYTALAGGASIGTAFDEAVAAVKTSRGGRTRSAGGESQLRHVVAIDAVEQTDRWPWELYVGAGAEQVRDWNLPKAAGDPLFGLPPLPERDLPDSPYRYLQWYTRDHADVFFGRGREIRELYELMTSPSSAPILLFYGASGVGKSSLLEAGLLPRLEASHYVRYARRDQALGLAGTMREALAIEGRAASVSNAWRGREMALDQPLILLLDQVEEHYTRPYESGDEMDEFLDLLEALFLDRDGRPHGKLVLSFRKEWLADIKKRLQERGLPRTEFFLERPDRNGIIEIIRGPAGTTRLRRHYRLEIENDLPAIIADDLLEDKESALAPTLQILLSKMWDESDDVAPKFTTALYQNLKLQGILLDDFLTEQLADLERKYPEAVASGLALDILARHTTPLGTAKSCQNEDLKKAYAHHAAMLPGLISKMADLYLLVTSEGSSRLAHDTLAPLIRARFKDSDHPGQRAARVLENRMVDWRDGERSAALDEADLTMVEAGQAGMHAWDEDELRLLDASRQARVKRQRGKQALRLTRIIGGVLITALAIVASFFWKDAADQSSNFARANDSLAVTLEVANSQRAIAEKQTNLAREASIRDSLSRLAAQDSANAARQARDRATQEAERARQSATQSLAKSLAAQALIQDRPERAGLLAAQSASIMPSSEASAALISLNRRFPNLEASFVGHEGSVLSLIFSADGQRIVSVAEDNTIRVWNVQTGRLLATFSDVQERVLSVTISSSDVRNIVSQSSENKIRLWNALSGRLHATSFNGQRILYEAMKNAVDTPVRNHFFTLGPNSRAYLRMPLSPDGQLLTLGPEVHAGVLPLNYDPEDYAIRMWNTQTSTLDTLHGHEGSVLSIAFSPDGQRLASGSEDHTIRLWNTQTGVPLDTLYGHEGPVLSVAFSPDGQRLISRSLDNTLLLWNAQTGDSLTTIKDDDGEVLNVVFSPRGSRVISESSNHTFLLWNAQSGIFITNLEVHGESVRSLAFSPDDSLIASGSIDNTVQLWNAEYGVPLSPLLGHVGPIESVAFSPNGRYIASGSLDNTIRVWNAKTFELQATIEDHQGAVRKVIFSPDGQRLASGSDDNTIRLWNPLTGSPLTSLEGHLGAVLSVAFNHDGQRLATGSADTTIRIWDVQTRAHLRTFEGHQRAVRSVVYSPDGQHLASGSDDFTIRLWNPQTGDSLITLKGHEAAVWGLVFSLDGQRLASGSDDHTVRLWDVQSGDSLATLEHQRPVQTVAFSPDSKTLASGSTDRNIWLWDVQSGDSLITLRGHKGPVMSVAFSPDGQHLASGSSDNTIRLWDAQSGDSLITLRGHKGPVMSVAFSPDGQHLASGSSDNTIWLWDVQTGAPLGTLEGHMGDIRSLALSPNGQILASGSEDNTIRFWNGNDEARSRKACRIAGRIFSREEWQQYIGEADYERACAQY